MAKIITLTPYLSTFLNYQLLPYSLCHPGSLPGTLNRSAVEPHTVTVLLSCLEKHPPIPKKRTSLKMEPSTRSRSFNLEGPECEHEHGSMHVHSSVVHFCSCSVLLHPVHSFVSCVFWSQHAHKASSCFMIAVHVSSWLWCWSSSWFVILLSSVVAVMIVLNNPKHTCYFLTLWASQPFFSFIIFVLTPILE